jgi:hypothetical protein
MGKQDGWKCISTAQRTTSLPGTDWRRQQQVGKSSKPSCGTLLLLLLRANNGVDSILDGFHYPERDAVLEAYPHGLHQACDAQKPVTGVRASQGCCDSSGNLSTWAGPTLCLHGALHTSLQQAAGKA